MEENTTSIKLFRKYNFEGKEYAEINLSGLADITAQDMIEANRLVARSGISVVPEMSMEYCLYIAAKAASLPYEFFTALSGKDAIKIKNAVTSSFFSED